MRFAVIQAEKANHPVALMWELLRVSRSGFYAWSGRASSTRARRDSGLSAHVIAIHNEGRQSYGSPLEMALLDRTAGAGAIAVAA